MTSGVTGVRSFDAKSEEAAGFCTVCVYSENPKVTAAAKAKAEQLIKENALPPGMTIYQNPETWKFELGFIGDERVPYKEAFEQRDRLMSEAEAKVAAAYNVTTKPIETKGHSSRPLWELLENMIKTHFPDIIMQHAVGNSTARTQH